MSNNNRSSKEEQKIKNEKFFAQFKGLEFWIWDPHEHLLAFMKTQGKCCFNHVIGEPKKQGRLQPLF
jgi:hypothetical protein